MTRKVSGMLLAALLFVPSAFAQQQQPEMTPEQQAEMEAYAKAGHRALRTRPWLQRSETTISR